MSRTTNCANLACMTGSKVYQNTLPPVNGEFNFFDNVAKPGMKSLIPPSLPAAARAICRARLPFAKGLPLCVSRRGRDTYLRPDAASARKSPSRAVAGLASPNRPNLSLWSNSALPRGGSVSLPFAVRPLPTASSAILGAILPRGIPLRRLAPVSRRIRRTAFARLTQLDTRRHGSEPHLEAEFTPLAALMRLREKLS